MVEPQAADHDDIARFFAQNDREFRGSAVTSTSRSCVILNGVKNLFVSRCSERSEESCGPPSAVSFSTCQLRDSYNYATLWRAVP